MLNELTREQVRLLMERAEIEAKGTFKPPPLDIEAVMQRAEELDPTSAHKADIYLLVAEVKRLRNGASAAQNG